MVTNRFSGNCRGHPLPVGGTNLTRQRLTRQRLEGTATVMVLDPVALRPQAFTGFALIRICFLLYPYSEPRFSARQGQSEKVVGSRLTRCCLRSSFRLAVLCCFGGLRPPEQHNFPPFIEMMP